MAERRRERCLLYALLRVPALVEPRRVHNESTVLDSKLDVSQRVSCLANMHEVRAATLECGGCVCAEAAGRVVAPAPRRQHFAGECNRAAAQWQCTAMHLRSVLVHGVLVCV